MRRMKTLPTLAEMERAFFASDAAFNGLFFVGVRTTGIFCRPTCSARKPLRKNISYFATVKEALFAGLRPCKRCRPLDESGHAPGWVAPLLARIETSPDQRLTDDGLRALGVEPARARRYFQTHFGLTFQAYCRARRLGKSLEEIRNGGSLDDAVFDHGYESHSGFRDTFSKLFGQPPGRSRATDPVLLQWLETPLGPMVAGANSTGVCLLEFSDRRLLETQFTAVRQRLRAALVPGDNLHLRQLKRELAEYFAGRQKYFLVPLASPGTPFQKRVWNELRRIPYGKTLSYEGLAARLGNPRAGRAVGRANGLNRLCVVIPCHRVVNQNGELGGYGGGMWRKRWLLEFEREHA